MKKLKNVLVIDDDKSTCFLEKYLLTELDVSDEIVCIYSGEEALEYIQEGIKRQVYPDLIFLDIKMIGMDGFEFLEELQAFESSEIRKTHIVLLTLSKNPRDIEKAASFKNLLKGYINKPLTEEFVKNILDSMEKYD